MKIVFNQYLRKEVLGNRVLPSFTQTSAFPKKKKKRILHGQCVNHILVIKYIIIIIMI